MDFKIEKGVPKVGPQRLLKNIFPFSSMEIGDSFFIPEKELGKRKDGVARGWIVNDLKRFNKLNDSEFTITIKKVEGGLRVWRNS